MAVVIQNLEQPDYTYLGQDISVLPDLSEDETLAVDGDCLIQDILNGWSQPTGLADGTTEGAEWGIDLRSQLNRGFTRAGLFSLKVRMEVQAERDDRVSSCRVSLTTTPDGALLVSGRVFVGEQPYPFSFKASLTTVGDLYIETLGTG